MIGTVTETGTATEIEIEIGTGTGTATVTEAETEIGTGTGREIAHHAGTVETAARVGAVSNGTDPRMKSSENNQMAQDSDLRAMRLPARPTLGHIQLRWTGRLATRMWYSRFPPGLLLCGGPGLLVTWVKGCFKTCRDLTVRSPVFFSRPRGLPLTATCRAVLMCLSWGLLRSPWQ